MDQNKILEEKQRKEKEKADNEARIKKHALDTTNKCYSKVVQVFRDIALEW